MVVALPFIDEALTISFEPFFRASTKRASSAGFLIQALEPLATRSRFFAPDVGVRGGSVLHRKPHDDGDFAAHFFGWPVGDEDIGGVALQLAGLPRLRRRQRITRLFLAAFGEKVARVAKRADLDRLAGFRLAQLGRRFPGVGFLRGGFFGVGFFRPPPLSSPFWLRAMRRLAAPSPGERGSGLAVRFCISPGAVAAKLAAAAQAAASVVATRIAALGKSGNYRRLTLPVDPPSAGDAEQNRKLSCARKFAAAYRPGAFRAKGIWRAICAKDIDAAHFIAFSPAGRRCGTVAGRFARGGELKVRRFWRRREWRPACQAHLFAEGRHNLRRPHATPARQSSPWRRSRRRACRWRARHWCR